MMIMRERIMNEGRKTIVNGGMTRITKGDEGMRGLLGRKGRKR